MSRATDSRTILAEIELGYEKPFQSSRIEIDWRFASAGDDPEAELAYLRAHLRRIVAEEIEKLQPEAILRPIADAVDSVWGEPETTVRDLVFAGGQAYQMETPDLQAISQISTVVYERMESARKFRTSVSRALKTIDRADSWFESVELTIKGILGDTTVAPKSFKSTSDRERFAQSVLADLTIYRKAFERRKAELVKLESRFHSEVSAADKALTTIKMFADTVRAEVSTTGRPTRGPAPAGREVQFGAGPTVSRFNGSA